VEAADVILEVLDARDPLGCRCASLERQVLAAGSDKRLVLVLNKVDLVPREVVAQWLVYLRNEFPVIAFKSSTQSQNSNLKQSKGEAVGGRSSGAASCFGAQTLLALMGNYCRSLDIRTSIRVGVVGYPNVGKSSLINSLKRSRVCGVGSTPGFTKSTQEIVLDKHVKLIDSPGIVFADNRSEGELVLRNCVKLEKLLDPVAPVEAILKRCDQELIMEKYMVPRYENVMEFLGHLARRLGRVKKGGVPDVVAAARIILQDWNSGKITYYSECPKTHTLPAHLSASVVASWSGEFDLAALAAAEGKEFASSSLMRLEDCDGMPMAPGSVEQGDEFAAYEGGMDDGATSDEEEDDEEEGDEDDDEEEDEEDEEDDEEDDEMRDEVAGARGGSDAYDFSADYKPAN
jgi:nuclear GTP-binding protein